MRWDSRFPARLSELAIIITAKAYQEGPAVARQARQLVLFRPASRILS
jgi:hypothetical protein